MSYDEYLAAFNRVRQCSGVQASVWVPGHHAGAGHVAVCVIRICDCNFAFEASLDISYVFAHDFRTVAVVWDLLGMCLVSQRKRERAAATELPGDFNGGEAMGPMAMGFNPMMNPMHGMMAQACTHCMLLIRLGCALLELAISEAAAQGIFLLCSHPALCVPGSCVQRVVKGSCRWHLDLTTARGLVGLQLCAAQAPWPASLAWLPRSRRTADSVHAALIKAVQEQASEAPASTNHVTGTHALCRAWAGVARQASRT